MTLALEPVRGGRWAVRTADGRQTLGYAKTNDEAQRLRVRFAKLVSVGDAATQGASDPIVRHGGEWAIVASGQPLATFASQDDARTALAKYAAIAEEPRLRRRNALAGAGGRVSRRRWPACSPCGPARAVRQK